MFLFEREFLKRHAAPFTTKREVRFQDVDAAGIIFYPRVLEYFHDAYLEFLSRVGQPLHASLGSAPWLSPIRHAEADFLRPLRFGDAVEVAIVGAEMTPEPEPSELTLGFRITKLATLEGAAIGQSVHTFVDAASFKRTPIPAALAAAYRTLAQDGALTPGSGTR
jgi:1,4-dihydroxy-2-naphthoyl-CoA hydrolase